MDMSSDSFKLLNAADPEEESTILFGIRAIMNEVIEEDSEYTATLTIIGIYDTSVGEWLREGQGNWDVLYDGLIIDPDPEWTFNVDVEEGTLTGPFLTYDFYFLRDPEDDSSSGGIHIMTLTENTYEYVMRNYFDTDVMEFGLRGSYEVSGDTMTIILTELYFPGIEWFVKGDDNWGSYYYYISPYLSLTNTFSVEGDQLTMITQQWDDWINDYEDIIQVYTRQ